jgi:DNA-binding NtrC family response regulator
VCVLIVEDEPLVNLDIADELQRAGYEVISVFDADQAIAALDKRDDISVVFTDIDMPGSMDGPKLAAYVRDRFPPVTILITNGKRLPSELPVRAVFMPKPYMSKHVIETIGRLQR